MITEPVRSADIAVLPVNKELFDIFTGKGWDNWTRFHKTKGALRMVAGEAITDEQYKVLRRSL